MIKKSFFLPTKKSFWLNLSPLISSVFISEIPWVLFIIHSQKELAAMLLKWLSSKKPQITSNLSIDHIILLHHFIETIPASTWCSNDVVWTLKRHYNVKSDVVETLFWRCLPTGILLYKTTRQKPLLQTSEPKHVLYLVSSHTRDELKESRNSSPIWLFTLFNSC